MEGKSLTHDSFGSWSRKRRPATPHGARRAVARQRAVQRQVARADRKHPPEEAKKPVQAGARQYPVPPLPPQHDRKTGAEHGLDPAQMALAYVSSRPFLTSNIIGATTLEQLDSNLASLELTLSDTVLLAIEQLHAEQPNPAP